MAKLVCLLIVLLASQSYAQNAQPGIMNTIIEEIFNLASSSQFSQLMNSAMAGLKALQQLAENLTPILQTPNQPPETIVWNSFAPIHNFFVTLVAILNNNSSAPTCTNEQRTKIYESWNKTLENLENCTSNIVSTVADVIQNSNKTLQAIIQFGTSRIGSLGACNQQNMMPCLFGIGIEAFPQIQELIQQVTSLFPLYRRSLQNNLPAGASCFRESMSYLGNTTTLCLVN